MNPASQDASTRSPSTPPALPKVDEKAGADARHLLEALQELAGDRGLRPHLVGGPVRDWLLGLPIHDLDVVVEGDAPALARALARALDGKVIVHHRFGTATVTVGKASIDLVTARKETYPYPGALPEVQPATLADDLARRDFTVNAMALPLGGARDVLVDPLGGDADLKSGTIRIIHGGSFRDDPTRMFRAARYEQRLGFAMDEQTLASCRDALSRRPPG